MIRSTLRVSVAPLVMAYRSLAAPRTAQRIIATFVLSVLVGAYCIAQASRDEFPLAEQTVICLGNLKSAQEQLARHPGGGDDLMASIVDLMTGARLAQARLTECRAGLAPLITATGPRGESAALFDRVIQNLHSALSDSLNVQKGLLDADPRTTSPGQMALDVSELAAAMDKAWRMLPVGVAAASHGMVEPKTGSETAGLLKFAAFSADRPSQLAPGPLSRRLEAR